mmetsp:Transcript_35813/g.58948  ORF Transcript_35813/g.58948 Transcript_35813/m.58948 type:complete len:201 (-) Transcript_35813:144-746(-)
MTKLSSYNWWNEMPPLHFLKKLSLLPEIGPCLKQRSQSHRRQTRHRCDLYLSLLSTRSSLSFIEQTCQQRARLPLHCSRASHCLHCLALVAATWVSVGSKFSDVSPLVVWEFGSFVDYVLILVDMLGKRESIICQHGLRTFLPMQCICEKQVRRVDEEMKVIHANPHFKEWAKVIAQNSMNPTFKEWAKELVRESNSRSR